MALSFFESIKLYVGFTEASSAALRELHPIAAPFFVAIVDDFATTFDAGREEIMADVLALVQELVDKGVLVP